MYGGAHYSCHLRLSKLLYTLDGSIDTATVVRRGPGDTTLYAQPEYGPAQKNFINNLDPCLIQQVWESHIGQGWDIFCGSE